MKPLINQYAMEKQELESLLVQRRNFLKNKRYSTLVKSVEDVLVRIEGGKDELGRNAVQYQYAVQVLSRLEFEQGSMVQGLVEVKLGLVKG